ncbi:hypothetical protein D918_08200 [Trichuris suis]|nr:hypothetical protein D918_08200 [Trichuris suis]
MMLYIFHGPSLLPNLNNELMLHVAVVQNVFGKDEQYKDVSLEDSNSSPLSSIRLMLSNQ